MSWELSHPSVASRAGHVHDLHRDAASARRANSLRPRHVAPLARLSALLRRLRRPRAHSQVRAT